MWLAGLQNRPRYFRFPALMFSCLCWTLLPDTQLSDIFSITCFEPKKWRQMAFFSWCRTANSFIFFNVKLSMMGSNQVEAHQKHSRWQISNERWMPLPLKVALLLPAGHAQDTFFFRVSCAEVSLRKHFPEKFYWGTSTSVIPLMWFIGAAAATVGLGVHLGFWKRKISFFFSNNSTADWIKKWELGLLGSHI